MTAPDLPAADVLRYAATRLAKLAEAATPNVCPEFVYSAVRHIARNCDEIGCDHGTHETWDRYGDSPWISAMGAQTAPPLVAWLRSAAEAVDHYPAMADGIDSTFGRICLDGNQPMAYRTALESVTAALVFARLILEVAS